MTEFDNNIKSGKFKEVESFKDFLAEANRLQELDPMPSIMGSTSLQVWKFNKGTLTGRDFGIIESDISGKSVRFAIRNI